jgi:hypothetical protein
MDLRPYVKQIIIGECRSGICGGRCQLEAASCDPSLGDSTATRGGGGHERGLMPVHGLIDDYEAPCANGHYPTVSVYP